MFDVNVFLLRCPWIADIENGTELAIAWVTQGNLSMLRGRGDLDVDAITDAVRELSTDVQQVQSAVERRMEEQLRPLHAALTTKQATARGVLGETLYENWITPYVKGSWETVCTKKVPHSGDYIHTHYDSKKRVMVDVKQYATSVPRKEVTKLWSDMVAQEIPLGLIVSMSSKITGCREVDIEYQTHGSKRYCMMTVSNAMDRKDVLTLVLDLLRNQDVDTAARAMDIRPLQEVLDLLLMSEGTADEMEKCLIRIVSESRTKLRVAHESMKRIVERLCEKA